MKRVTTAALTAALVGASLAAVGGASAATAPASSPTKTTAPATVDSGFQPPPIQWVTCTDPTLIDFGAQCGMLSVPLDYSKPSGTTIKLALSVMKHTVPPTQYQGIMLLNPGGPGGSGDYLSVLQQFVPKDAGFAYDFIGFDPRGVGSSQPSLSCDGNYFPYNRPNYNPTNVQIEKFWLRRSAGYSQACLAAGGQALLNHLKTTDNVADMESIRKAFKASQINFYGFSYGTYLGQVYATLHPDRVRRMILDSNVDPRKVWYQSNLDQDVAFETTMSIWFRWVAANDGTYHLGTTEATVSKLWFAMRSQAVVHPFAGKIGPDEWTDAFLQAGYYVYNWEELASGFQAAVAGDYGPVTTLYDGANGAGPGSDNGFAVYLGTECTDTQWPLSWAKWKADATRINKIAPFETWANTWFNAPCLTWAGKASRRPVTVTGKTAPPILLIDETYDAATPFSGSLEVRKLFPRSILIEGVGGSTHAGSLSGVSCTDDRIADYLLTGALDARQHGNVSDVKCPPVPAPDPAAAASARSQAARAGSGLPMDLRSLLLQAQGH
ncbi:MAG: alpha/beta fold hydrolase [Nostocoides sp.]